MARRKRRAEEAEKENAERWLLTYADMITLLMLFFIVLYSMSNVDEDKYKKVSEALEGIFSGGGIFGYYMNTFTTPGETGTTTWLEPTREKPKAIERKIALAGGKAGLAARVRSSLDGLVKSGKARIVENETGIVISVAGDLFFGSGSAGISRDSVGTLRTVAEFLGSIPNQVIVEGHTDDSPVNPGQFPSNWELSSQRALAVLHVLQDFGVPDNRVSAAAYGSSRPMRPNDTPEGRAFNRRVDIAVVQRGD
jgi:chemotaxis protein MotB